MDFVSLLASGPVPAASDATATVTDAALGDAFAELLAGALDGAGFAAVPSPLGIEPSIPVCPTNPTLSPGLPDCGTNPDADAFDLPVCPTNPEFGSPDLPVCPPAEKPSERSATDRKPASVKREAPPNPVPAAAAPPDPPPATETKTTLPKEAKTDAPNAPAKRPDHREKAAIEGAAMVDVSVGGPATAPTDANAGTPKDAEGRSKPASSVAAPTPPSPFSDAALNGQAVARVEGGSFVVASKAASDPGDPAPAMPLLRLEALRAVAAAPLEAAPDLGIVPKVVVAEANVAREVAAPMAVKMNEAIEKKLTSEKIAGEGDAIPTADEAVPVTETAGAGHDEDAPSQDSPSDPSVPSLTPTAAKTAATERPETGADRPQIDRHLVVRQVADRIERLVAARPREGVTIHLEPRDLGSITLVVKGLASSLDVQMTASDERVRQSLEASRPELAQALAPRSIELREVRIGSAPSASPGASANGNGQPGSGNPQPEGRPRPPAHLTSAFSNSRASKDAPVRISRRDRGVDLLV